ncbi:hypothetical protein C8T65DRAFT_746966 [Cerioporus squamosus]|nr:hypothetical protein C8T65DRAFT_746966 [Cerioporus squamosus]
MSGKLTGDSETFGSTYWPTAAGPNSFPPFGSTTTRPTQWPTPSSSSSWGPPSQQPYQQPVHTDVSCDYCGKVNMKGIRYKCLHCPSYDRCESCMAAPRAWLAHDRAHQFFPIHHPGDLSDYNAILAQTRVVHHGTSCDGCSKNDIQGTRHRCLACENFDYCEDCIADPHKRGMHQITHPFFPITSALGRTKYENMRNVYRATSLAAGRGPSHTGVVCDACKMSPLVGVRYRCLDCADYDMCVKCFSNPTLRTTHNLKHVFFPVTTPGDFTHFNNAVAIRQMQQA